MYTIEMTDDWGRTMRMWIVNRSEGEVKDFVEKLNNGLSKELGEKAKSNTECYFYYEKCEVVDFPTEDELIDIMKPSEYELKMADACYNSGLSLEGFTNWDFKKVTDMTGLFK